MSKYTTGREACQTVAKLILAQCYRDQAAELRTRDDGAVYPQFYADCLERAAAKIEGKYE